jgi:hypothetical protein
VDASRLPNPLHRADVLSGFHWPRFLSRLCGTPLFHVKHSDPRVIRVLGEGAGRDRGLVSASWANPETEKGPLHVKRALLQTLRLV